MRSRRVVVTRGFSLSDLFVGFEQLSHSVDEGAGSVTVCAIITDVPTSGYEGTVTASITSHNTPTSGLFNIRLMRNIST